MILGLCLSRILDLEFHMIYPGKILNPLITPLITP